MVGNELGLTIGEADGWMDNLDASEMGLMKDSRTVRN